MVQFFFSPDEASRLGRHAVRVTARVRCADAFVQRRGLARRLNAQFLRQGPATGFVLCQRRAALTVPRQQPHHLPVRFFPPGFERQEPPRKVQRRFIRAARVVMRHQFVQHRNGSLSPAFPFAHQPQVKLGAAVQAQAIQKLAPVQLDRRHERVGLLLRRQRLKSVRVQPI